MKARDLIAILEQNPDDEVLILEDHYPREIVGLRLKNMVFKTKNGSMDVALRNEEYARTITRKLFHLRSQTPQEFYISNDYHMASRMTDEQKAQALNLAIDDAASLVRAYDRSPFVTVFTAKE